MEKCKLCDDQKWLTVRVDPVPPWSDFMSVDLDDDACYLCNPDGAATWGDDVPYFCAQAIGGFEGQYGLFQQFVDGKLMRSILIDRSVINYSSWQPPLPIEDCPVCHGWGIWSNNGQIMDCIACGGKPVELRTGYEPLYAWWLRKIGPGAIYMQRGRPESTPLSCEEIIHHIEMHPNIICIN